MRIVLNDGWRVLERLPRFCVGNRDPILLSVAVAYGVSLLLPVPRRERGSSVVAVVLGAAWLR